MGTLLTDGQRQSRRKTIGRNQEARRQKQLLSWFDQYGHPQYTGLVGQIFFPTNGDSLDFGDKKILEAVSEHFKIALMGSHVHLRCEGYADFRGTTTYNRGLGLRRAKAVRSYLTAKLGRYQFFRSSAGTSGEKFATRSFLAGDRRVDIFSNFIPKRPPVRLSPIKVTGQLPWPLSTKFTFRTLWGAAVSIGPGAGVGGQVLSIEIRNVRTSRTAMYTYGGSGAAVGFPFSFSTPSSWAEKTISTPLDVGDFEGPGNVYAITLGKNGTAFVFDGPQEKGKMTKPLILDFEGWEIVPGAQMDAVGHWFRRQ